MKKIMILIVMVSMSLMLGRCTDVFTGELIITLTYRSSVDCQMPVVAKKKGTYQQYNTLDELSDNSKNSDFVYDLISFEKTNGAYSTKAAELTVSTSISHEWDIEIFPANGPNLKLDTLSSKDKFEPSTKIRITSSGTYSQINDFCSAELEH